MVQDWFARPTINLSHSFKTIPTHTFSMYLYIVVFTLVRQLYVEVSEVDADGVALRYCDIPCPLLVVGVYVWEVRGRNSPIHFL